MRPKGLVIPAADRLGKLGVQRGRSSRSLASGFPDFHTTSISCSAPPRTPASNTAAAAAAGSNPRRFRDRCSMTPEQALDGTYVEVELSDGTTVEVQTPPEAGDGWRLRLEGVAPGGRDHFLQLQVRTDEGLRVDGLRVLYRLDLPAPEGALGGSAVVPTLEGPVRLRIPPGTSSGRLLRLRGKGLERDGRRGDQIVEVRLVVPDPLAEDEEALYKRLQELLRE